MIHATLSRLADGRAFVLLDLECHSCGARGAGPMGSPADFGRIEKCRRVLRRAGTRRGWLSVWLPLSVVRAGCPPVVTRVDLCPLCSYKAHRPTVAT